MDGEHASLPGFGPAAEDEPTVFGAPRPGYPLHRVPPAAVDEWLACMRGHDVRRVVCLLMPEQLAYYDDLPGRYRAHFGAERVRCAPIPDLYLADLDTLTEGILPFLAEADRHGERVVVHCSAGIGRTGHVLAAWLVAGRGYSNADAIAAVARGGRDARESGDADLDTLLDACRAWGRQG
ncbi:MAG TPA: dual specificity protein phosphatase family protein [Ktedonobacterales bacterium]|jgi:protein-tyrosine phosphatase